MGLQIRRVYSGTGQWTNKGNIMFDEGRGAYMGF